MSFLLSPALLAPTALPNLLDNGSFDAGSASWGFNGGYVSFSGGQCIVNDLDGSAANDGLWQDGIVAAATHYDAELDIASVAAGGVSIALRNNVAAGPRTTAGIWTVTDIFASGSANDRFSLRFLGFTSMTINSIRLVLH